MGDELADLFKRFGYGFDSRTTASRLLVERGEEAADYLRERLTNGDNHTRYLAAFALEDFAPTEQRFAATQALLAALYDAHPPVRRRAARTLRFYREPRMNGVLVRWLDSPDEADRTSARAGLSGLGSDAEREERFERERHHPILQARRPVPLLTTTRPVTVPPTLTQFLTGRFPPTGPAPEIEPGDLPMLRAAARGNPGETVWPGLFPRPDVKLARLALAAAGDYPADLVRAAADTAYDDGRPYHAHDALACALAHPGIDSSALRIENTHGRRSRRKTQQVLDWALLAGYLPRPAGCVCAHGWFTPEPARAAAVEMSVHWDAIRPMCTLIGEDLARWIHYWRCERCGDVWAETSIVSGQAELYYAYPVDDYSAG